MKRKLKILILSFCFFSKAEAQNLIPNSSFEYYSICPHYASYIYYGTPWFQPNIVNGNTTNSSSSDLFNACCIGGEVGVPSNSWGGQLARTGNGYAGLACSYDTTNYREYIEVPLISPLINGQQYCVEFYVSLADIMSVATSSIGAYFSVDSLLYTTQWWNAIDYVTPQIENDSTNFLSHKGFWMKIFGTFTAQGGEKFMTIGNFRNPQNTHIQTAWGGIVPAAYYYIDDISVTACDTTLISVYETENNYNFSLFPNPSTGSFNLNYDFKKGNDDAIFKLYDIRGKLLNETVLNTGSTSFDFSDVLTNGIYFYQVSIYNKILKADKVVIIK